MSSNSAEVLNLSAPQPVAYDFESNRPGPVIFWNRGSPNVGNNHGSGKTAGRTRTLPKGTSAHTVLKSRPLARDVGQFRRKLEGHRGFTYGGNVTTILVYST